MIGGGITFATFKPCCNKLKSILMDTELSNPDHISDPEEDAILESILSGEEPAPDESPEDIPLAEEIPPEDEPEEGPVRP